jgi:hypothetical protein
MSIDNGTMKQLAKLFFAELKQAAQAGSSQNIGVERQPR